MAKGNDGQSATIRAQNRVVVSTGLSAVRQRAASDKRFQFTSLLHHVSVELLRKSYFALQRKSAAGIDSVSWGQYGENLDARLINLHGQIHSGKYRASPALRVYISKADGGQRPLGIQTIEDKVVQQAIVYVLESIFEGDFLGFSYGFRPNRGQHDALDAISVGICRRKIAWVFDADLEKFFDSVNHEWIIRFLKHRIRDRRIIRLIVSWLSVGYVENDSLVRPHCGMPQGAVISPILSNIYLHYVFDLWINAWRKSKAEGDIIVVRYADDFVIGFQFNQEALKVRKLIEDRFEKFGIRVNQSKSQLIRFGKFAKSQCAERGIAKPPTFTFLGFRHYNAKGPMGFYDVGRKTDKDRMRKGLQRVKIELRRRMHDRIHSVGTWLRKVLIGYMNYFYVPGNKRHVRTFFKRVWIMWYKSLRRRSQRSKITWKYFYELENRYFPQPHLAHQLPTKRFDAKTLSRSPVR